MSEVCVVTVAHGRHTHLQHQLRLLDLSDPKSAHVIVAIEDRKIHEIAATHSWRRDIDVLPLANQDLGLPLAQARNVGVRHAISRGADLVVLLDVDCVLGPDTLTRYVTAASVCGPALLCGPVTYLPQGITPPAALSGLRSWRDPHTVRPDPPDNAVWSRGNHELFWSLSAALTPKTWSQVGGFHEGYVGYGGEDTDFAFTARAHDVDLVWVGGADAYHQHHPVSSPPVEHLEAIVRNATLFHQRWGVWPMQGWLTTFAERRLIHFDGNRLDHIAVVD